MRFLSVALLVALPCGGAAAQPSQPPRALAIEDYYRLQALGSPTLSPDGRWVAFTVTRHSEETNSDSSQVWLVAADGSASPRRVSPPGPPATNPRWLETGRLRFVSAGRSFSVDPAAPDAPEAAPLESGPRPELKVASPDGKWTATLRNTAPAQPPRVARSDFELRHQARFKGREFDWLEFQRDGSDYPVPNPTDPALNPAQEVFLTPTGGGEERQLTRLGLRPRGLQWSPDGSALLFTADSSYRDELRYEHGQVWAVALDGSVRRLSRDLDYDYSDASYSPDGRWVLAMRQLSTDAVIARKLDHGGATDLVVLPAAGGADRLLTADWDYLPAAVRWSRDGKQVYFTGGIGGTQHLFRVATDGGPVEQVTAGERRLSGLSFDGAMTRMAFLVGRLEAPAEISTADLDGRNERRLTHFFDALPLEIALDLPERLLYKSKDGTPVEGWLYHPYGYRPGAGPYPLIVFSHGGPHSAVGYDFNFKLQYFAANGYFVLTTNFRSSTGYGEKFLWATWGGWGNKDGEDVMAGVDHVIARYPIDRKQVGTVGHSYGGFMSNWLITQYPDRFAAAAVGAGIVNWVSDYGTADIARTKETEFYGTPWDPKARELMMRQSPLSYANRVKAATLFINGEIDQRVPYSEAEQMFVALKKNGVPAKVIQYAGQPHGIAGSWNNVHRMLNELHWLDRYLKPAGAPPRADASQAVKP
ncbi:MAG TPA: S9 family peptidase [Gemmatimonadales bacterium]|jgi:dipeptidyl aminopeptidase/acylaminoacyl peptidase